MDGIVSIAEVIPVKGNFVINLEAMMQVLGTLAVCRECQHGNLEAYDRRIKASCASYIMLRCNKCYNSRTFWSVSGKFEHDIHFGDQTIRKRNDMVYSTVLGGRIIGIGESKLNFYHAILNIPPPPSRRVFHHVQKDILIAAEFVATQSMITAKDQLIALLGTNPETNCVHAIASYDGAYQMRSGKYGGGFSRYCFASAISVDTSKVLSYEVACNSCRTCTEYNNKLRKELITLEEYDIWKKSHKTTCPALYSDLASVHLESAVAPIVVKQAFERGVIFSGLVCDGDNKTDETLRRSRIYQEHGYYHDIGRLECLSHVVKRLKANLNKRQEAVLKESRTTKRAEIKLSTEGLSFEKAKQAKKKIDKKYVGTLTVQSNTRAEWGYSTQKEIKLLSISMCGMIASYYRLAVQRNIGNIDEIIQAINAIPLHLGANDENAKSNHRYCPKVQDSWCQYQAAIFDKRIAPHHPNFLSETAVQLIFDTFDEFKYNHPDFIAKISDGRTSNNNEAIHSLLFQMVTKTDAIGMDIMRTGAALAVIRYNEGFQGIQRLFETLGVTPGKHLLDTMTVLDNKRIYRSDRIIREQCERFAKKQRRSQKVNRQVKKHGVGYSSGQYTAAQPDIDTPTSTVPTSSTVGSDESDEICEICGFSDESGLVGIGLGVPVEGDIDWVQCDLCDKWYHLLCLALTKDEIPTDSHWYCERC